MACAKLWASCRVSTLCCHTFGSQPKVLYFLFAVSSPILLSKVFQFFETLFGCLLFSGLSRDPKWCWGKAIGKATAKPLSFCLLICTSMDFEVRLGSFSTCKSHLLFNFSLFLFFFTDGIKLESKICWNLVESIHLSTREMFSALRAAIPLPWLIHPPA